MSPAPRLAPVLNATVQDLYPLVAALADNSPMSRPRRSLRIDTGWPFLVAGIMLLASAAVIPALDDLAEARWQRDRALALERHRAERLSKHERYLAALQAQDHDLMLALAATQLRAIPAGKSLVLPVARADAPSASVFPALEPPAMRFAERRRTGSILEGLTLDRDVRPWLIGAGGVLLMIGAMPTAGARPRPMA